MSEVVIQSPVPVDSPDRLCLGRTPDKYNASDLDISSVLSKSQQRSLNSMFCGCLNPRTDFSVRKDFRSQVANDDLLPSSAVQSLKHLALSYDTNAVDDMCSHNSPASDSDVPFLCLENNAKLPPSVLFPASLLPPEKSTISTDSTTTIKTSRSNWSRFRPQRWKRSRKRAEKVSSPEQGTSKLTSFVIDKNSVDTLDAQIISNQESVFSPSPVTSLCGTGSNKHVHKIDTQLLYTPRFDSIFRRPTTTTTLLGPRSENDKGKKCFVIDLDETLVHSSFKMVEQADFKVGVEIDGITHRVYVLKRPHVDVFLSAMANLYECVLFTASLAKYADPVADFIDKWNAFRYRLFRDACVYHRGNYVKDLSHLGRPINQIVILDNSPASYMFHASHAVQISSWFDDANDRTLLDLIPYFEQLASHPNVVEFLRNNNPPTPSAAVGTVGLPTVTYPMYISNTPVSCRTPVDAGGGVISSIERPAVTSVVSPTRAEHQKTGHELASIAETQAAAAHADPKKATNAPPRTTTSIPLITKMAAPSFGPSISPALNDPSISFPAPLSLATYLPIPTHLTSALSSKNPTPSTSSQSRVSAQTTTTQAFSRPTSQITDKYTNSNQSPLSVQLNEYKKDSFVNSPVEACSAVKSIPSQTLTSSVNSKCRSSGEPHHQQHPGITDPMKSGFVRFPCLTNVPYTTSQSSTTSDHHH